MASTRRLETILAADVVGYSRLMSEDEASTARAIQLDNIGHSGVAFGLSRLGCVMYATESRSSLDRPRLNPKDKGRAGDRGFD